MRIEWIIIIVGLFLALVLGIKKYIMDTDTYDNTGILDKKRSNQ